MVGDSSCLVLPAPPRAEGPFFLELQASPAIVQGVQESQPLEILVNDTLVLAKDITAPGIIKCEVPAGAILPEEPIRIVLRHPGAISPAEVHGRGDVRKLSLCMWLMTLAGGASPETDAENSRSLPVESG
jgi:hypothetical protein